MDKEKLVFLFIINEIFWRGLSRVFKFSSRKCEFGNKQNGSKTVYSRFGDIPIMEKLILALYERSFNSVDVFNTFPKSFCAGQIR